MDIDTDEVIEKLKRDFLDDTRDRLDRLETRIDRIAGGIDPLAEGIAELRREAHTIKGLGSSFGFPVVSAIAHRLEDYLVDLTDVGDREAAELVDFTSWIRRIIDGEAEAPQAERILRSLPVHRKAEAAPGAAGNQEVLLVTATAVQAHYLERELHALGYRTIKARSAPQAFELVARLAPDAVITSAVLDGIGGVDLARALAAMRLTTGRPVALLTSFDADHPDLRDLPDSVTVIHHKGADFARNLAAFLSRLTPG